MANGVEVWRTVIDPPDAQDLRGVVGEESPVWSQLSLFADPAEDGRG
jgi:hypothetical protein